MRQTLILLPLIALLTGCGPTEVEMALSTLFALPLILLTGGGIMWTLSWAWRKRRPEWETPSWRGWRYSLIAGGAVACLACFHPKAAVGLEWTLVAYVFAGGAWLSFALLTWRIYVLIKPGAAHIGAIVWATLITVAPVVMLFFKVPEVYEALVMLWFYTGFMGAVGGGLWLILMLEPLLLRRAPPGGAAPPTEGP